MDGTNGITPDDHATDRPAAAPSWAAPDASGRSGEIALRIRGLRKRFGDK